MKFVHAADLHLGSIIGIPAFGLSANPTEPGLALWSAFEALIQMCIDQDVSFLLLAGDTFQTPRVQISDQTRFRNGIARLYDSGIKTFLIHGNHDPATEELRFLNRINGLKVFDSTTAESHYLGEEGVAIHGRSFVSGPVNENLSLTYPDAMLGYYNIGMLHTSLSLEGNHGSYAPCSVQDLVAKSYDYWALGHVHTRQVANAGAGGWIGFPGNLCGRSVRETGDKGALLVEVDNGQTKSVKFMQLSKLNFELLQLDLFKDGPFGLSEGVAKVTAAIDNMELATTSVLRLSIKASAALATALQNQEFDFLEQVAAESLRISQGHVTVKDIRMKVEGEPVHYDLPFELDVTIPPGLFDDLENRLARHGLAVPAVSVHEVESSLKDAISNMSLEAIL